MEDNKPRIIKKRYIFMAALMIIAGVGLVVIPDFDKMKEAHAEEMLLQIMSDEKVFSTDEIAEMLISGDPLLQLIDVRTPEEFEKFSLPGAINIPLADLLTKDETGHYKWNDALNQDVKTTVFYSNGDIYASRAWSLCTRLKFKNVYFMNGGLNGWFETIIQPKAPAVSASVEEEKLYQFRLGARQYFLGGGVVETAAATAPTSAQPTKKAEKKAGGGGGC